jgi:hypothetical protein
MLSSTYWQQITKILSIFMSVAPAFTLPLLFSFSNGATTFSITTHNIIGYVAALCRTYFTVVLRLIMLTAVFAEGYYGECRFAEGHYAERHYAERHYT